MATSDLGLQTTQIDTSLDSIVIVNCLGDLPGGCTLDVSDVPAGTAVIRAGHIIVKTAEGEYKPLGYHAAQEAVPAVGEEGQEGYSPAVPALEAGYNELAEGEVCVGVLKTTCLVSDPRAAILTIGQVNEAASPAPVSAAIKVALPRIEFLYS